MNRPISELSTLEIIGLITSLNKKIAELEQEIKYLKNLNAIKKENK